MKRFVWEDARSTRSHDFVTVLLFLVRFFCICESPFADGQSVKCFGSSRQAGQSAKMPDEDARLQGG